MILLLSAIFRLETNLGIVPALTRSEMFEKNVEQNKMYDDR